MADPVSIATAMKAITTAKAVIAECLAKYNDFHAFKKECAAFQSSLRDVLDILDDIQNDIRAGNVTGNTKLQRPMELLKSATVAGCRVLDQCSSEKILQALWYSKEHMGKLEKASEDIKQTMRLLLVAGVRLQVSTRRIMDCVESRLEKLSHQIDLSVASKQEVVDLIRAEMQLHRESQAAAVTTAVVDILVEKGLVSDANDYSDQLVELRKQAVTISQEKVVFCEANLELVLELTALQHKVDFEDSRSAAGSMRQSQGSEMSSVVLDCMTCPISRAIMNDPVTLVESGLTYDRKTLCTSLLLYPDLEPATGQRFDRPLSYTPNITVRNMIMAQHGDAHYQKHDDDDFKIQYPAKWKELVGPLPSVVVVNEHGGPGNSYTSDYAGSVLTEPTSATTIRSGDIDGFNSFASTGTHSGGSEREVTKSDANRPGDKFSDSEERTHNATFSSDPDDPDGVEEAVKPESETGLGDKIRTYWRSRRVRCLVGAVVVVMGIIVGAVVGVTKGGTSPTIEEKFNATLPPYTTESLQEPSSPQFRAYEWATMSDQVPERDSPNDEAVRLLRMIQRFALATLLYSFGLESWVESTVSECQWGDPLSERNVKCNANRSVVFLDFKSQGVRAGPIPREIVLLTNLASLDLVDNSLSSSFPTELAQLSALTWLDLQSNSLTSSIPTEIGRLTALQFLRLSLNSLNASIPTELGLLSALTGVDLFDNSLTSSIPTELMHLSALRYLDLSYNSLNASIPTVLGQLSTLNFLSLSANPLASSIPTELGQLSNLGWFYFDNTLLTGTFPSALCSVGDIRIDCSEVICSCCSACSST